MVSDLFTFISFFIFGSIMSEQNGRTVALYTLGCRLNQYETDAIREQFVTRGFKVVPYSQEADVYVVNTCTVTAHADYRGRQMLRRAIRKSPNATVVATGCYAQTSAEKLLGIEGIDLVLGNAEKGKVVDYVLDRLPDGLPEAHVTRRSDLSAFDTRMDAHSFDGRTRATLRVQDGCDQFCTFCIIPWARGRHRSRPLYQVVSQARTLLERGFKEIILTGVHIGDYGTDLDEDITLTDTIRSLVEIPDSPRLRLSSIWPTAITDEMMDMMEDPENPLCRYLHLAVQHGTDDILERMRRTYTTGMVENLLDTLVSRMADFGIGTDIMVGFPGETDKHFNAMHDWLQAMPFAYLHVFSYSRREKTRAASYPNQVHPDVITERSRILRNLSKEKSRQFSERFIGKTVRVLVEDRDATGRLTGHTDPHLKVYIPGEDDLTNTLLDVTVDEVT
ncbi:uncharacterized protein METZ01_LOCUS146837, partial [marine metagenome]